MASPIHLSSILGMLHKRPRCPHCGGAVSKSLKNCPYCGKKLPPPPSTGPKK